MKMAFARLVAFILTSSAWIGFCSSGIVSPAWAEPSKAQAKRSSPDYVVYSVSQALNLTDDPKQASPKDYYINMGGQQGVKRGAILEVRRRVSTFDLLTEQLYRDLTIPIAKIKVIHVEPLASIARLQKLSPANGNPVFSPRAVMVGDFVKLPD